MNRVLIKSILVGIIACLSSVAAFASKTYVVSVGVSETFYNSAPAPSCVNDARALANIFNNHKNCEVFMLLNKNATRAHILKVLKTEFAKAREEDEIIFAYSGHGFDGGISTYLETEVVYCSEVQSIMLKSKAKRKVMLIMSCHSGSFTKKYINSKVRSDSRAKYDKSAGVMLFLSCKSDENALAVDPYEGNYSLFCYGLLDGLSGSADSNHDRRITARELYNYVAPRVTLIASSIDSNQHPMMWGKFSDNMVILDLR